MSETVILELIRTFVSIITAIIAGIITLKVNKLHRLTNSRMTELIESTRSGAKAEGKVEEKAEEEERKSKL